MTNKKEEKTADDWEILFSDWEEGEFILVVEFSSKLQDIRHTLRRYPKIPRRDDKPKKKAEVVAVDFKKDDDEVLKMVNHIRENFLYMAYPLKIEKRIQAVDNLKTLWQTIHNVIKFENHWI